MAQFLSGRNLAGLSVEIHLGSQHVRSVRLIWHYPDPFALAPVRPAELKPRLRNGPMLRFVVDKLVLGELGRDDETEWN